MLYEIKALKAPWPAGAKVGDVVEMPSVPTWAVGKCTPAPEGADATVEFVEPVAGDGVNRPLESENDQAIRAVEHFRAQAQEAIRRAEEAHALELAELQAELDAATAGAADLRAKLDASEARAASLQTKLDEAESDEGKAAAALKEAEQQAATERAASEAKAKGKK
ncbi:hypothetical protein [Pseudorhodoferax sp. Leaf265]|uniref:hypothetical protein n=1 Tax=Pseudorhodoferax sp. Leaf265 TaxID=1736315 RepID=UPI0006F815F2|nr:hypothetical protein [Pseudorhodoferax sp. Leaf265]KQP02463.1 hypothetical protein ASF45_20630 [Pseudorhodoferax sp. Leaf265]